MSIFGNFPTSSCYPPVVQREEPLAEYSGKDILIIFLIGVVLLLTSFCLKSKILNFFAWLWQRFCTTKNIPEECFKKDIMEMKKATEQDERSIKYDTSALKRTVKEILTDLLKDEKLHLSVDREEENRNLLSEDRNDIKTTIQQAFSTGAEQARKNCDKFSQIDEEAFKYMAVLNDNTNKLIGIEAVRNTLENTNGQFDERFEKPAQIYQMNYNETAEIVHDIMQTNQGDASEGQFQILHNVTSKMRNESLAHEIRNAVANYNASKMNKIILKKVGDKSQGSENLTPSKPNNAFEESQPFPNADEQHTSRSSTDERSIEYDTSALKKTVKEILTDLPKDEKLHLSVDREEENMILQIILGKLSEVINDTKKLQAFSIGAEQAKKNCDKFVQTDEEAFKYMAVLNDNTNELLKPKLSEMDDALKNTPNVINRQTLGIEAVRNTLENTNGQFDERFEKLAQIYQMNYNETAEIVHDIMQTNQGDASEGQFQTLHNVTSKMRNESLAHEIRNAVDNYNAIQLNKIILKKVGDKSQGIENLTPSKPNNAFEESQPFPNADEQHASRSSTETPVSKADIGN